MNDKTDVTTREREAGAAQQRNDAAMLPPVDVFEDATGITLKADLPGVPKDKLQVRVEADVLIIVGEISLPVPQRMEASHVELQLPRYRRSFTLSKELDADQVGAEYRHGVLTLRIPKAQHAQPRKIEVQVA